MQVTAKLNNLRIAPRKTREVADLVRGKRATEAQTILSFTTRKSAPLVLRLLNSAIASAKQNLNLSEENLFISKIIVNEGTKLKRWHPMSRGRAYPLEKRTSHITIELDDIKNQKVKNKRVRKTRIKKQNKI